jgi:hypothetical protein
MATNPEPADLPDETPGGSTIADPEVFNDPENTEDHEGDGDQSDPAAATE